VLASVVHEVEHPATGNLDRLIFLSDGVFAIAMTLLVVQFTVPAVSSSAGGDLGARLLSLGPMYFSYALSFLVIAAYWTAHQRIFRHIVRVDAGLVWINLLLLSCIAFLPFPTSVLGTYGDDTAAVTLYAGTLTVTGLLVLALWLYATVDRRLVRPDLHQRLIQEHVLRAVCVPLVFAISMGIAQVNPSAAEYSWIAIAVLAIALRWIYRDARAPAARERRHRSQSPENLR
jgi:uncharacterized membrane protein